jgi:hypothetical protein
VQSDARHEGEREMVKRGKGEEGKGEEKKKSPEA